jgi:chromosome segregation ATPase
MRKIRDESQKSQREMKRKKRALSRISCESETIKESIIQAQKDAAITLKLLRKIKRNSNMKEAFLTSLDKASAKLSLGYKRESKLNRLLPELAKANEECEYRKLELEVYEEKLKRADLDCDAVEESVVRLRETLETVRWALKEAYLEKETIKYVKAKRNAEEKVEFRAVYEETEREKRLKNRVLKVQRSMDRMHLEISKETEKQVGLVQAKKGLENILELRVKRIESFVSAQEKAEEEAADCVARIKKAEEAFDNCLLRIQIKKNILDERKRKYFEYCSLAMSVFGRIDGSVVQETRALDIDRGAMELVTKKGDSGCMECHYSMARDVIKRILDEGAVSA